MGVFCANLHLFFFRFPTLFASDGKFLMFPVNRFLGPASIATKTFEIRCLGSLSRLVPLLGKGIHSPSTNTLRFINGVPILKLLKVGASNKNVLLRRSTA